MDITNDIITGMLFDFGLSTMNRQIWHCKHSTSS